MRGSPIWQAILVVVVFALAGVPVWCLTRPGTAIAAGDSSIPIPAADPDHTVVQNLVVDAVFAPPAQDFQVKCLDQSILEGRGPAATFTARWSAEIPAEGADLVVRAHWNAGTTTAASNGTSSDVGPSAARVSVRFPDGRTVEKTFWAAANGSLADVFTVPGPAAATP